MKMMLSIFFLALSVSAVADSFTSEVNSIDISKRKNSPHLILMENGRVVFVDYQDEHVLRAFEASMKRDELLEVEVSRDNGFKSAQTVSDEEEFPGGTVGSTHLMFDPTVVSSHSRATSIFRRMRRDYQNDSQCYNRAHVWAYEEYLNSGLKSKKLFMFFTRRYIRNYRYKWWFHVAPMVLVKQGRSTVERVLDRRYTGGPRYVSTWTRNFVHSGRKCPVVYRYNDYRNNQESQDCYLIPVSMYFWQPRDILRRDQTGSEKTQFFKREVDHAYWEAF